MTAFPYELMEAAKEHVLGGRDPRSRRDWEKVVGFWAANVHHKVAHDMVWSLCQHYGCPLERGEVRAIVTFQLLMR